MAHRLLEQEQASCGTNGLLENNLNQCSVSLGGGPKCLSLEPEPQEVLNNDPK